MNRRGRGGRGGRGGFDWTVYRDRQVARRENGPEHYDAQREPPRPRGPAAAHRDSGLVSAELGLALPPHSARLPCGGTLQGPGTLSETLMRLDGAPYGALRQLRGCAFTVLRGEIPFPGGAPLQIVAQIKFKTVQPDPFAPGSQIALRVPFHFPLEILGEGRAAEDAGASVYAGMPAHDRKVALRDWFLRRLHTAADVYCGMAVSSLGANDQRPHRKHYAFDGKTTNIDVALPSQHVLERSAVVILSGADGPRPIRSQVPAPTDYEDDDPYSGSDTDAQMPSSEPFLLELRSRVSLPNCGGRRVDGRRCHALILEQLLGAACCALLPPWWSPADPSLTTAAFASAALHVACDEEQSALRGMLHAMRLCAFVPDGSVLPRRSIVDDRLLPGAIPFRAPDGLAVNVELPVSPLRRQFQLGGYANSILPNGPMGIVGQKREGTATLRGLGIRRGVTSIVGGAFHGKSTLLRALEVGIYNHAVGDGREYVVTDSSAVKIRAEDRRFVAGVDISPFITSLPVAGKETGKTTNFSTMDASGATSQASNIVEAISVGASTLLIDEDTAATNFMIRDPAVSALLPASSGGPSVIPFADKVRPLFEELGVSTIIVTGATGHFFPSSDMVVAMDNFVAQDVTAKAKEIALRHGYEQAATAFTAASKEFLRRQREERLFDLEKSVGAILPGGRTTEVRFVDRSLSIVTAGAEEIDISCLEQMAERGQSASIAACLSHLLDPGDYPMYRINRRRATVRDLSRQVVAFLHGNETFDLWNRSCRPPLGTLSRPRPLEVLAALFRLRTLCLAAPR